MKNKIAILEIGGKQYLVKEGDLIKIDRIKEKEKEDLKFENLLLWSDGKEIKIGQPYLENAFVKGRVLKHGRGKKITVIKFRRKTRYKVKKGYRPAFSEVQILEISP
jgi:large subunit ribosomal protein L21